jgi:hypothetical protein
MMGSRDARARREGGTRLTQRSLASSASACSSCSFNDDASSSASRHPAWSRPPARVKRSSVLLAERARRVAARAAHHRAHLQAGHRAEQLRARHASALIPAPSTCPHFARDGVVGTPKVRFMQLCLSVFCVAAAIGHPRAAGAREVSPPRRLLLAAGVADTA